MGMARVCDNQLLFLNLRNHHIQHFTNRLNKWQHIFFREIEEITIVPSLTPVEKVSLQLAICNVNNPCFDEVKQELGFGAGMRF